MPTTNLTTPILHSNGSGYRNLSDSLETALLAVSNAIRDVSNMSPHGRDYYVSQDSEALNKAITEHVARMNKLTGVRDELEQLAWALEDQENNRRRPIEERVQAMVKKS